MTRSVGTGLHPVSREGNPTEIWSQGGFPLFIVDLACDGGHEFEGWYGDAQEYRDLADHGEVTCPLCQSANVTRVPSATRISTATSRGEKRQLDAETSTSVPATTPSASVAPGPGTQVPGKAPPPMPMEMQKALSQVLDHVRRTHEDAGAAFAEKAIRMHRGEEEERPIHGHTTPEDERRMNEEGVAYAKIPIPDIDKN